MRKDAAFEVFGERLADIGLGGVVVALAVELTCAGLPARPGARGCVCAKRAVVGMVGRQRKHVGSGWLHHGTVFISSHIDLRGFCWAPIHS